MTDQATFLDEVARFGDPWHGLYRGGVLELPNATTRALTVAPDGGDCFEVKVPGTQAVTTDTADGAAGMTWLNYGLLAGRRHTLYQTELGPASWLYVAPDNSTWKATLTWSGINAATLALAPLFGTTPTQSVSLSVSPAISYQAALAGQGRVMDIRADGAAVAWAHLISTEGTPYTDWNFRAASLLEISGVPPAASATLALIHEIDHPTLGGVTITDTRVTMATDRMWWLDTAPDPDESGWVDVTYDKALNNWGDPPQGVWSSAVHIAEETTGVYTRSDTIGYAFDGTGALQAVKFKQSQSDAAVGWSQPYGDPDVTYVGARTIAQFITIGAEESSHVSQVFTWAGTDPTSTQTTGYAPAWFWRYSNRLYGLTEDIYTATNYHPPMTPSGQSSVSLIAATVKPYATYHPITGAVIFSAYASGVVCWV